MPVRTISKQRTWFRYALQLRGSVVPSVLPRILLCGGFAVLIEFLYWSGVPLGLPGTSSIVLNLVLGLLLVFRTNTAYERFWEGRKLWGTLINTSRNLARYIWVSILEKESHDRQDKQAALYLIVAFAVATKLHLRQQPINREELEPLLSASRYSKLQMMNNPPLEIAFWLQNYLQQQYQRQCLNVYQLSDIQQLLNTLVDILGGCERILKTPIPLAYAIHLKQLLLVYCLMLPFQFVRDLNWWTVPMVMIISFTLFGIEEIGLEIENPFGCDPNDLQLDAFCETMKRNIDDLMMLEPISTHANIEANQEISAFSRRYGNHFED
ncbi:MAG: bestrophin family ion channel [Elainellaceae cyanobacterium]